MNAQDLRDAEYKEILDQMPVAVLLIEESLILYANDFARETLGFDQTTMEQMSWLSFIAPAHQTWLKELNRKRLMGEEVPFNHEVQVKTRTGDLIWVKLMVKQLRRKPDPLLAVTGYRIGEAKKMEERLGRIFQLQSDMIEISRAIQGSQNSEKVLDTILAAAMRAIPQATMGSILELMENQTLRPIAHRGFPEEYITDFKIPLEKTFLYISGRGDITRSRIIDEPTRLIGIEKTDLGPGFSIRSNLSIPIFTGDELYGMVNLDSDLSKAFGPLDRKIMEYLKIHLEMSLSQRKRMNQHTETLLTDRRTGLANRTKLETLFEPISSVCRSQNITLTLALFSITDLENYIKAAGLIAGDRVTRQFSQSLKRILPREDIPARVGDNCFAVLLFEKGDAGELKNRLKDDLKNHPNPETGDPIEFTMGTAEFRHQEMDLEDLILEAEKRLLKEG